MTRLNSALPQLRCALAWAGFAAATTLAQPTVLTNADFAGTTDAPPPALAGSITNFPVADLENSDLILTAARQQVATRDYAAAETNFLKLLAGNMPEPMRQTALFELARVVHLENDLPRAGAIYTQYLQRWPGDPRTPEVYLRQGQIFREMGLPNLALAKFYGVMTTALSLKSDQVDYFKKLVLQAQVEIAETHFLEGEFKDAADYYSRLLAQSNPALDRAQIQFRLVRSLEAIGKHDDAASQAQDFLAHFPDSPEEPEVRYHLAQAFKGQNRDTEALKQVKIFLKEQHDKTTNNPAVWSYWQQRVGNEIGNALYEESDFVKALQIYLALAELDSAPSWQLPVRYQIGLTYEKLLQPQLAIEAYRAVATNAVPLAATNLTPGLKAVIDMATWRMNFLEWNSRAEIFNRQSFASVSHTNLNSNRP